MIRLLSLTVLGTRLGHEDLVVSFEYGAGEDTIALRADALGSADEASYLF